MTIKNNWLNKLWKQFKNQVQKVPPNISACEFECRKLECTQEEWENCENRKQVEVSQETYNIQN